jgi:DNA-binding CsgD family transcriptional regulator
MDRKALILRIYTVFLVVIFLGVIIPDFFSPDCFSNFAEILRMIIISVTGLSIFVVFFIFPKRWELLCLIHIVFAVWLTVQTAFPSKYMISALLYTEAIVIAFTHGFFTTKTRRKFIILTSGLFVMPLFEPGFTLKVLLRAEFLNAYIFGVALFSFFLIRHYFIEHIVKEKHILFSNKEVLYLQNLNLCEREMNYINLLIKGVTYKEIAETFEMSESSVKKHMSILFSKFGVSSKESFLAYISQFDVSFPAKEEEL